MFLFNCILVLYIRKIHSFLLNVNILSMFFKHSHKSAQKMSGSGNYSIADKTDYLKKHLQRK